MVLTNASLVFLGMLTGASTCMAYLRLAKGRDAEKKRRTDDDHSTTGSAEGTLLSHPLIADDVTQIIGKTPLVRLNRVTEGCGATVLAKMESMEPCCSIKERIALSMIDEAEKRGQIKRGVTTLVEPTSGNTGIALAMAAAARNYKAVIIMPDSMSLERRVLIKAFGATLVLTEATKGLDELLGQAEAIVKEIGENAVMLDQLNNPDNPKAHRETTGPELWAQTSGKIDAFVAGVGTGGTITGCAQYLKSVKPSVQICAVEPAESAVLSGGEPGPHAIQGIGAGFVPRTCDTSLIDQVITCKSADAMTMARELATKEGLMVGISAGAAVHAALELGRKPDMAGKTICVIIPSFGERYLSTELFSGLVEEAKTQKNVE